MVGNIHSTESFGTVDGPGIRFVIFMQGCPLRCKYCHNPDTWEIGSGKKMTVPEILSEYNKNKAFYRNGGITVTGGEPLLQVDFLIELFETAKKSGIHTCIDTSGVTFNRDNVEYKKKIDRLMASCDLVMLDIKHIDSIKHIELTGKDNMNILDFAVYLAEIDKPVWIRNVIVEGYTDGEEDLKNLGKFIGRLTNLKALDILPYHTMGINKYRELGIEYPLEGVSALSKEKAVEAKRHIFEGIKSSR